jgi:23S rRNA pseudouridine955/2504/2580 synthase
VPQFNLKKHIVLENEDFLVINKPAGISSLHERISRNTSILEYVKGINENYQLCHRIDKYTSGALLVAKHNEAYKHFALQFEKRKINKVYHAVVCGSHRFENTEVKAPLTTTRSGKAAINYQKGKDSLTVFNSIENFRHYTLVECKPITGRLHQIRIHLTMLKSPIAMDVDYGGCVPFLSAIKKGFKIAEGKEEQPMIKRFALHAKRLEFKDLNDNLMEVDCPYTKDFSVFLKQLRKYNSLSI